METIDLYCGYSHIVLGGDGGGGFLEVEYYSGLATDCVNGVVRGNIHLPGDAAELLERFKSDNKYIEAAGGYVLNNLGQSLVIIRNGFYDLPKGKIEKGEDPETAAVREVNEETGVQPKIERKILDTYHFYRWGSEHEITLKKTHWYLMTVSGHVEAKPQTEEGITECLWMDDARIDYVSERTHRNLKIIFGLKKNGEI